MFTAATRSSVGHGVRWVMVKVRGQGQGQGQGVWWRRLLSDQPIPTDLKRTVDAYLHYVRPLVTADHFSHTEQLSEEFLKGPGQKLQQLFHRFAIQSNNWLTFVWHLSHLMERESVLGLMSGMFFPAHSAVKDLDGQLWLAARIMSAVLDLKDILDSGEMEPQKVKGEAQCMHSYQQLFSSCRAPAPRCDHLLIYPASPKATRHVNVIYNNQIFSVDVYGEEGRALSTEQLHQQLRRVTEQTASRPLEEVGALTALKRDTWAQVYQHLMEDSNNIEVLTNIHRSLFVLCLDQPLTPTPTTNTTTTTTDTTSTTSTTTTPTAPLFQVTGGGRAAEGMMLGGGVNFNACNRWLEKSLQVIVGAEGTWGTLTEHSAVDGTHLQFVCDHVSDFLRTEGGGRNEGVPGAQVKPPTRLQLNLGPKSLAAIEEAKQFLTSFGEAIQTSVFTVSGMGKEVMKEWGVSPDALIQTALQLAYYRRYHRPCVAVEYVSKRGFHQGRLDRMLGTTPQAVTLLQHMDSPELGQQDKQRLVREALDAHKHNTGEVKSGCSLFSHFQALQIVAELNTIPAPPLFQDPAFKTAFYPNLCSTQINLQQDGMVWFKSEEEEGFSCPFVLYDDHINFTIVSDQSHQGQSSSDHMTRSLTSALSDLCRLWRLQ